MIEAIGVFTAQLVYVMLLGLQSRHVRDSQMVHAAIASLLLGILGLTTTVIVIKTVTTNGGWEVYIGYLLAGPVGINLAIWWHDRSVRKKLQC